MTSDFLSRPLDVTRFGLLYASAQKNIGIAGLTIVIIRDDLLDQALPGTPAVFNYGLQARNHSRVNTPPVYSIYIAGLVFSWLMDMGGLTAVERLNRRKAESLYAAIDADDFYRCPVATPDRSLMNVCFRLPDQSLETMFLKEAEKRGLIHLQGHGVTGGIRASIYNAMSYAGVDALIAFMRDFSTAHAGTYRVLPQSVTG
jgi:phosphoserine aminotransferase